MTDKKSNLVLTGFMGTGKTVIGRLASEKLGLQFVDIDSVIEGQSNLKIAEIFSEYGESYFREQEAKIIEEFSKKKGLIISTGGGAVINSDNISNLRTNGVIIFLKARPEVIFRNVSHNLSERPLLKSDNPIQRINHLLEQREKYYKNNDFELDVSDLSIEQAVDKIEVIFLNELDINK